jgi:putative transposase
MRDLASACRNWWAGLSGKRRGAKLMPPRVNKRRGLQAIRFLSDPFRSGERLQRHLRHRQTACHRLATARRQLATLHAAVADKRLDCLHRPSSRLRGENQTVVQEHLNGSGMLKTRKLARSIAAAGRRQLRTLLEARAEQYDRQVVAIHRWLPTSQMGSTRRRHDGKTERSMRNWQCPSCAAMHERGSNAARTILAEASPWAA